MIEYHFEIDFEINNLIHYTDWISRVIEGEDADVGQLNYIFCADDYLLDLNQKYLNHDTFTDIITFNYTVGNRISGDIFISVERVRENAIQFKEDFDLELKRVMIHGILHLLGYNDKTPEEIELMRKKETSKIKLFHVEQ